jgi:UDP-glucose 4-epimerase
MSLDAFYENKNILITGGLGFIGSTLAIRLVEMGAKVTLVDSLIPEYGGNLQNIEPVKDQVIINIADMRDEYSMNHLVQGRDIIFNLAGTLSHTDSMKDPYTDLQINCVSQLSILESCRKFNPEVKILFAGTRGQYGKADYLPVDENHPMHPTDVNGINNMAGEWYHILYNNVYGIRACSLRLTNTYGPRHQMKHHRQGIINWFVRLIIEGKKVQIFGDGKQIRDATYVDDAVDAFLLAAVSEETNGQVYNLGGYPASLVDIVQPLIEITGRGEYELVPFPPESKAIEVGDYIASFDKIKDALGWSPKIGLREGLEKTVEYYEEQSEKYF